MLNSFGVNHAANLPAYDSKELQILFGTKVSDYIITVYRRTLNLQLILSIDSDVDLCKTITYLCEDDSGITDMSDTALDGPIKEQFIGMPRIKTFHGFCKGGFKWKFAVEQLECIWQEDILKNWFNTQLATSIENGRTAIMARWYRQLMVSVHPKNTGNNAGLMYGGNVIGDYGEPVLFDSDNCDLWFLAMRDVIKQMPPGSTAENEFGVGLDTDAFIFGPSIMESVLMSTDLYMQWQYVGDCGNCAYFKDTFDKYPRGIMPITGDCIESYTCTSGGESHTVYPILFGKRYKGAKAALRIKSYTYNSEDQQSVFYQTIFYHHMHVYDPRYLGLAYIVIDKAQPTTITSCTAA